MTVVSRRMKAGVPYTRFGCTAHSSRGSAICANALTVSERKASRTLVNALRDKLSRPELIRRFVSSFTDRAATLAQGDHSEVQSLERKVRASQVRIANLTESLAKIGWSDAVASKLREEEERLGRLKVERSSTATAESHRRPVPHPTAIAGYLKNLFTLLETDAVRGRELLSRFISPVVMTPETDCPARRYRATGAFNMTFFLAAASSGAQAAGKSSCAGLQPHVGNRLDGADRRATGCLGCRRGWVAQTALGDHAHTVAVAV
jgi:hypothetical protein